MTHREKKRNTCHVWKSSQITCAAKEFGVGGVGVLVMLLPVGCPLTKGAAGGGPS